MRVTTVERLLALAQFQLGQQLMFYTGLDAKASTVVSADAVFTGLLFRLNVPLASSGVAGVAVLVMLAISVVLGIAALWTREVLAGPLPTVFYAEHGNLHAASAQAQLLSDLTDALTTNEVALARKTVFWTLSASGLVASVLVTLALRVFPT
jgi:hypothetical protein